MIMATGDRNGDTAAYDAYCAAGERDDDGDGCICPTPSTCPYCSRMYPCDCAGCPHVSRTITARGLRSCGHAHHPHAPVGSRVACHDCAAEAHEEARDESRTREKR